MKRLQEKMLILLIDEKTRILCKDCKKKSAKIIKKSQKNVNFIKKLQKSVNFVKKALFCQNTLFSSLWKPVTYHKILGKFSYGWEKCCM